VFRLAAAFESELWELDEAGQEEMLKDAGLDAPARDRLIGALYNHLGLITFYTAGEPEAHAWALRRGESALDAAGVIHTDIARGFIRAEVVSYEDFAIHNSCPLQSLTRRRGDALVRRESCRRRATRWTCEAHPRRLRTRDLFCHRAWGAKTAIARCAEYIPGSGICKLLSFARCGKTKARSVTATNRFAPRLFQQSIRLLKAWA
jgi:hypothetical protein